MKWATNPSTRITDRIGIAGLHDDGVKIIEHLVQIAAAPISIVYDMEMRKVSGIYPRYGYEESHGSEIGLVKGMSNSWHIVYSMSRWLKEFSIISQ